MRPLRFLSWSGAIKWKSGKKFANWQSHWPRTTGIDWRLLTHVEFAALFPEARRQGLAYHATGMTDAEGYLAMGCAEILVHTWDACRGLGDEFVGPSDLSSAILARTFPWVHVEDSPWQTLLWAFGRVRRGDEAPVPDGRCSRFPQPPRPERGHESVA